MAFLSTQFCSIKGIVSTVPKNYALNADCEILSLKERELFIKTTGIEKRRIADQTVMASDLCFSASEKVLGECKISASEIEGIVFVTQTPDYLIPGNASLLQNRLGITKNCVSLDINSGCSGYVYGLSVASALVHSGLKHVLLLVGDTLSKIVHPQDKSTLPIFSDAGSATLLSRNLQANPMYFNLQSDGAGAETIFQKYGGRETLPDEASEKTIPINFMEMRGLEVFNFTLREVSANLNLLLNEVKLSIDEIDQFIFHQANLLLNESIRKQLGISPEKNPYSLKEYGNTSCASIPVTLSANLKQELQSKPRTLALSGFGAGLSWGSAIIRTEALTCVELLEV